MYFISFFRRQSPHLPNRHLPPRPRGGRGLHGLRPEVDGRGWTRGRRRRHRRRQRREEGAIPPGVHRVGGERAVQGRSSFGPGMILVL